MAMSDGAYTLDCSSSVWRNATWQVNWVMGMVTDRAGVCNGTVEELPRIRSWGWTVRGIQCWMGDVTSHGEAGV